jgi:hypothetical protein
MRIYPLLNINKNTNIYILLFAIALYCSKSYSQNLPPKQAYPFHIKQIHSGHSLTDPLFYPHWPGQYVNLMTKVRGMWAGNEIGKSTIPGSPMRWRWNNSSGYPDAKLDISEFELLCVTEVANLCYEGGSSAAWYQDCIKEQRDYLTLFTNNAWNNGNQGKGAATLLWTNWVNINDSDGPFRTMLDNLGAEWERMQDHANQNRPDGAPPVYIIPGHKMMARLYDDVQAGIVPDITNFNQFFSDNIHTNELGAYAIAMIHYACIYNKNPLGLPPQLIDNPPAGTPIPSPALAQYLQKMVWDVVTKYDRTGIKEVTSGFQEYDPSNEIHLFPNPAEDKINIVHIDPSYSISNIKIYDNLGSIVYDGSEINIDVSQFSSGIYILRIDKYVKRFVKN